MRTEIYRIVFVFSEITCLSGIKKKSYSLFEAKLGIRLFLIQVHFEAQSSHKSVLIIKECVVLGFSLNFQLMTYLVGIICVSPGNASGILFE